MSDFRAGLQAYLTPPARFSRSYQRFYSVAAILCPLAILNHALYIPLFWWMNIPVLVAYNFGSVMIWSLIFRLVQRGQMDLTTLLASAEVLGHAILCARYIGWEFGYQYILFTLVTGCFIIPGKRWLRLLVVVFSTAEFAILSLSSGSRVWQGDATILAILNMLNIMAAFGLSTLVAVHYLTVTEQAEVALQQAHARSEELLHNILPTVIAERLKRSNTIIADRFDNASIFFADIANFTPLAQRMTPAELVQMLNDLFSHFDELVRKHNLEKIKTMGDAYMVAAGVPVPREDHAEAIAEFALDLQASLAAYNSEKGINLNLRIGINSGPVIAGVIGKIRFLYDLWGDSVNTASRMESHGVLGEIHVSEATRNLLVGKYKFEDRGMIEIKGKDPMRTYFLRGRKET